jgi:hypothetical protein
MQKKMELISNLDEMVLILSIYYSSEKVYVVFGIDRFPIF